MATAAPAEVVAMVTMRPLERTQNWMKLGGKVSLFLPGSLPLHHLEAYRETKDKT
jgi:hypothetical protein